MPPIFRTNSSFVDVLFRVSWLSTVHVIQLSGAAQWLTLKEVKSRSKLTFALANKFNVSFRYANTDYALYGSLWNLPLVQHIVLTYDIACQYYIHLVERFTNPKFEFPERVKAAVHRIVMFVPKLHLKGHKDDCQYRWSLNFTCCTGRVHGEGIEGSWGEAKQAGGSTKEMNAGHRHDVLNDFQIDWNWCKAQGLSKSFNLLCASF